MEQASCGVDPAGTGAPPGTRRLGGTHESAPCRGAPPAKTLRADTSPLLRRRSRVFCCPSLSLFWAGLEEEEEDLRDFEDAADGPSRWEEEEPLEEEGAEAAGGTYECPLHLGCVPPARGVPPPSPQQGADAVNPGSRFF